VSSYSDSRCCPSFAHQACRRGADPRVPGRGRIGHRGNTSWSCQRVAGSRLRLRLHTALQDPRCRHATELDRLAVYVIVMLPWRASSRVWIHRESRRSGARGGAPPLRTSEHLVGDRPVDDLLKTNRVRRSTSSSRSRSLDAGPRRGAFESRGLRGRSALRGGTRTASVHTRDSRSALARILNRPGNCAQSPSRHPVTPLASLRLRGLPTSKNDRAVLTTFANDAALALERAQLREQALRSNSLKRLTTFARV